jgi:zinc transport system substrate-binding protein
MSQTQLTAMRSGSGASRITVLALGLLLSASLLATGCSGSDSAGEAKASDRVRAMRAGESLPPITVLAAFGVLSNLVGEVAGGGAVVTSLAGPGVEAHDLELSPDQVQAVIDVDLVVYVGNGFQPSLEAALRRRKKPTLELLAMVEPLKVDGGIDPHFWLDPLRYAKAAGAIGAALAEVAPESKSTFQSTAVNVATASVSLDQEYLTGLKGCAGKDLITAHTAFGYLATRYGLNQIGVVGLSPEAEPSGQRLQELVELIKVHHVTTVFSEELFSSRVADTLAREAKVKTILLSPIETFSPKEVADNVGYVAKMRNNLARLRLGLGCV